MRRIRIIPKHPNKLFETWLEEWRDAAAEQNPELQEHFTKALEALRKYPLPLRTGKECILLQHFGHKLCLMIDKRLEKHKAEQAVKEKSDLDDKTTGRDENSYLSQANDNNAEEKHDDVEKEKKRTYKKRETSKKLKNKKEENEIDADIENERRSQRKQENCESGGEAEIFGENGGNKQNPVKDQQTRIIYSDQFRSLEDIDLCEEELRKLDQIAINDDYEDYQSPEKVVGSQQKREDGSELEGKRANSGNAINPADSIEISDDDDYPYVELEDRVYHNVIDVHDEDLLMPMPGTSRNTVIAPLDEDDDVFNDIELNIDNLNDPPKADDFSDRHDDEFGENSSLSSRVSSQGLNDVIIQSPEKDYESDGFRKSQEFDGNKAESKKWEEEFPLSQRNMKISDDYSDYERNFPLSQRFIEPDKINDNDDEREENKQNYSDEFVSLEDIEISEGQLRMLEQNALAESNKDTNDQKNDSEKIPKSQNNYENRENDGADRKNSENDTKKEETNKEELNITTIEISDDEECPNYDFHEKIYHKMSEVTDDDDVLTAVPGPSDGPTFSPLGDDDEVFNEPDFHAHNLDDSFGADIDSDIEKILSRPPPKILEIVPSVKGKDAKSTDKKSEKTTRKGSARQAGATKKVAPKRGVKRSAKDALDDNRDSDDDDDVVMTDYQPLARIPSGAGLNKDVEEEPVVRASDFSILPLNFDVILLVDTQEVQGQNPNDPVLSRLTREGTPFEVRHLNVGDFLWIARCRETKQELVLPYIVERKRVDDLAASIKDGRYHEQKFRLRRSGIYNVVYMIERLPNGSMNTSLPVSTLMQAAINSIVHDGFTVKFTRDQRDSVLYLASFTKLLVKLFMDKLLIECDKQSLPKKYNVKDEQIYLMEFGKFYKATVKNRVWTVKEMFIKQLLQIKGLSLDGVLAIVERYPTPRLLKEALDAAGDEGAKLLAKIPYAGTKRKLGPVLARTIWQLFTFEELK